MRKRERDRYKASAYRNCKELEASLLALLFAYLPEFGNGKECRKKSSEAGSSRKGKELLAV